MMRGQVWRPLGICQGRRRVVGILAAVALTALLGPACGKILFRLHPPDLGYKVMAKDTVWKKRKSPYRITESLVILGDATLRIQAGVEVLLGPGASIHCYGRIVADGDEEHPIRFARLGDNPWEKIECFGGKEGQGGKVQTNVFRHCVIEGGHGLKARDTDVHIEACVFRDHSDTPISLEFASGRIVGNRIYHNTTEPVDTSGNGGGMVVYSDREVLVADNEVYENVSIGGRDGGGGIYAYAYDRGKVSVVDNRVWGNRSDRNGGGLVTFRCTVEGNLIRENQAAGSGGGLFAIGGIVRGNRIEANHAGRGGGVFAEKSLLVRNSVADNTAPPSMGGGLFYYGDGRVEENTFYRNGSRDDPSGEAIVVSGGPVLRRNNIVASLGYALMVQTHSLAPDLDARENFWGTRDPDGVVARIYDWLDDAGRGLVLWDGFLDDWVPEAPPPPPDFLLCQADGQEWTLRWEYPLGVPISGFRIYWGERPGFPLIEGEGLNSRLRSVRLRPPSALARYFCLSAFREGGGGQVVESALSRFWPVPVGPARKGGRGSGRAWKIEPLRPSRCGPAVAVPLLEAVSEIPAELRTGSRWVIAEVPADFSAPLFDSGPVGAKESLPVPAGLLHPGREYAWRVAFQLSGGGWTDWSPPTRFCTPPAPRDVIRGPIRADLMLGRGDQKAYRVTGNVFVPQGVSVKILPGTVLRMEPKVEIRVRGDLLAKGTKAEPILFTGQAASPWGRLFFEGRGRQGYGATGGSDEGPGEQGILGCCVVEHGHGIVIEEAAVLVTDSVVRKNAGSGIAVRDGPVRIVRNRIMENRSPSNGGGIYVYGSRLMYILDNEITGNTAGEDGGGVFGYGYRSNTAVNLSGNRIEGNRCGGDGGGVWASRSALVRNRIRSNRAEGKGGGLFATFALIHDNEIAGNSAYLGGGVYAETNSSLEGNRIIGNRCLGPHGGGVYMNFWGMSIKNEVFRANLVTRNRAAGSGDTGGVYLNGSMIFEYNRIYGNQGIQLYNANPADRPPLSALHCYWGTSRPSRIEAAIHDRNDDPQLALVLFKPFAKTPREARAP